MNTVIATMNSKYSCWQSLEENMQKWKLFKVGKMSGFPFCLSFFFVNVEILFSQQDEFYKNKASIIAYKIKLKLSSLHSL